MLCKISWLILLKLVGLVPQEPNWGDPEPAPSTRPTLQFNLSGNYGSTNSSTSLGSIKPGMEILYSQTFLPKGTERESKSIGNFKTVRFALGLGYLHRTTYKNLQNTDNHSFSLIGTVQWHFLKEKGTRWYRRRIWTPYLNVALKPTFSMTKIHDEHSTFGQYTTVPILASIGLGQKMKIASKWDLDILGEYSLGYHQLGKQGWNGFPILKIGMVKHLKALPINPYKD